MKKSFNILLMVGILFSISEISASDESKKQDMIYKSLCNVAAKKDTDQDLKNIGYVVQPHVGIKKAIGITSALFCGYSLLTDNAACVAVSTLAMVGSYKLVLDDLRTREMVRVAARNDVKKVALIACNHPDYQGTVNRSNETINALTKHVESAPEKKKKWTKIAEKPCETACVSVDFFGTDAENRQIFNADGLPFLKKKKD